MNTSDFHSVSARRYLDELNAALTAAPAALRAEIITDIADELRGLNEEATKARIAELGDPRAIAADAADAQGPDAQRRLSKVYPTITAIVLTAGWYVIPVIGWVAGLVMIGIGDLWSTPVRRRSVLVSAAAALVSVAALIAFRTAELWPIGLTVFLLVPLITNIFIGAHLRQQWGREVTDEPGASRIQAS